MTIENVTEKDAGEIFEIYRPYVEKTAISFEYAAPSVSELENRIRETCRHYPYLKAVENGKMLGYAYAGRFKQRKAYDWAVEVSVYVSETAKGKGVGRALCEALEERLKEMGIRNLNACIVLPNTEEEKAIMGSVAFHEKMGFTLVGVFHRVGCKFGRWYDMCWMEKLIGDHNENPKEIF